MIQSFYTWIWYPFSLYCYHLITVPGMRMFPPRWKLTGWRRALAWFAAAMVSGFLAKMLRLGVLALLKITGWPDTFFFRLKGEYAKRVSVSQRRRSLGNPRSSGYLG